MEKQIKVKDIMTTEELQEFDDLNFAVLTSATSFERNYYNKKIKELIAIVKKRYFDNKKNHN